MITRISNGRVIDPSQNIGQVADLWIRGVKVGRLVRCA
jgi:hypothetical protein